MTQIMSSISNGGVLIVIAALFIWFVYNRETKTLPRMIDSFETQQKAQREANGDQQKEMRTLFETQQKAQRESYENQNVAMRRLFETQMDREREVCQKWHEENRQANTQVLSEIKEQRHLIRNLAHSAGLEKALGSAEAETQKENGS